MKLLLYCTKAKTQLSKVSREYTLIKTKDNQNIFEALNGKIVAECDFEVEEIYLNNNVIMGTKTLNSYDLVVKSKVEIEQMRNYLKGENGYAIHIKNLHIFDEPIELERCYKDDFDSHVNYAPQNMMYSWLFTDKWNRYALISIKPQWMCKILNGEKTIEVRKKVLKEMLK